MSNASPVSVSPRTTDATSRALLSGGSSLPAIHEAVIRLVDERAKRKETILDVGCGVGNLRSALGRRFARYVGIDLLRYDGFPVTEELVLADLNHPPFALPAGCADVVISVETIEHLENPRAFVRELVRLLKPSGLLIVTTPNQLSLLSKLTLVMKNQFNAFQASSYPAHLTALLESDLRRIALESSLVDIRVTYTHQGRMPLTSRHWPARLGCRGRLFSDNVLLSGLRPANSES